jgi:anti-sigma B factor antagonist
MVGQVNGTGVAAPASKGGLEIREHWIDTTIVLALTGALDMCTAPQLSEAIDIAMVQSPATFIADLTHVDFLGSAGMNALVSAYHAFTPAARFAVVADGPVTRRPLSLIGLDKVLDIYPTLDDALLTLS